MVCAEMVTSVARVVVRAVVPGLALDEVVLLLLLLLLEEGAVFVVVLLVRSPAINSASMSSKSLSAVCAAAALAAWCLPVFLFFDILRGEVMP
jgi:hypothetical protein